MFLFLLFLPSLCDLAVLNHNLEIEKQALADLRASGYRPFVRGIPIQMLFVGDTGRPIDDRFMRAVSRLHYLKRLGIAGEVRISNNAFVYLRSMEHLKELSLSNTGTTDEGVREIAKLSRLEELDLSNTGVSNAGLAEISKLTRLKRLVLPSQTSDQTLLTLVNLNDLQALSVQASGITDKGLEALKAFKQLRELNLSACKSIVGSGLSGLTDLSSLRTLDISFASLDDEVVGRCLRLKALRRLEMQRTNVSGKTFLAVKRSPDLEVLNVRRCGRVTDATMSVLCGLKSLRNVDLSETNIGDKSVEILSSNIGLEELRLSFVKNISDESCAILHRFERLRKLDLMGTGITDAGIDDLVRLKSIEWLNISRTAVSEAGVKRVRQALPKAIIHPGLLPKAFSKENPSNAACVVW